MTETLAGAGTSHTDRLRPKWQRISHETIARQGPSKSADGTYTVHVQTRIDKRAIEEIDSTTSDIKENMKSRKNGQEEAYYDMGRKRIVTVNPTKSIRALLLLGKD